MFDFSKKLQDGKGKRPENPIEIYETLDRASDKGPLRNSQADILENWYVNYRDKSNLIIKLHTGSGKTLVGLLILQSRINTTGNPVIYLCPNKFLVDQTADQAKQFGIKFCRVDANNNLPQEFQDGSSILIATTQLLFNGLTKFGLRNKSISCDSIVLDDSHACIETINDAFTIKIKRDNNLYKELFNLFDADLEEQGEATTEEIRQGVYDSLLVVPYWAWQDKIRDVVKLLVKYKEEPFLLFVWDLVKDILINCQCIFSGSTIEISPFNNPLEVFGTFTKASHRIFMSATTSNDAFFIKGLGIDINVVTNPLKYAKEKWSGEKMILIPYFIHQDLTNPAIVSLFGKPSPKKRIGGVAALTPSNKKAKEWALVGAEFPNSNEIQTVIKKFKEGDYSKTLVLANRYDGIDLPDDNCRILILDSKPIAHSLADKLQESYRENSKIIDLKTAQKIEQGLGRSVRGEKDYCIIFITGMNLINQISGNKLTKYFSDQTNKQLEIGKTIVSLITEQATSNDAIELINEIIAVSLKRDEKWKIFYNQEMNSIVEKKADTILYTQLQYEKKAEDYCATGQFMEAANEIQKLLDNCIPQNDKNERAYYLQEMARYYYQVKKSTSNEFQLGAYKLNRFLLKPKNGIEFQKLEVNKKRTENISNWIKQFENYADLNIKVSEILTNLSFGIKSDHFEKALNEFGQSLGFGCERPDKELKKGPDNLWNIHENEYILFECKNEVNEERSEIVKEETGQMNNACAWFNTNYRMNAKKYVMIIPTLNVSSSTGFNYPVEILRKKGLNKLKDNYKKFFMEFSTYDLAMITESQIENYLKIHQISKNDILNLYTEPYKQKK